MVHRSSNCHKAPVRQRRRCRWSGRQTQASLGSASFVILLFSWLFFPHGSLAVTVLGTGTDALLGGDLTDPENDIDDTVPGGANFNWVNATASSEPHFSPANGHEAAFDVFDNKVGSGKAKWCCDGAPQWVEVEFDRPYQLTHFTIASGNDVVGRDPTVWRIDGSNDGIFYEVIYRYDQPGVSPFTARNQVLRYDVGEDFNAPGFYTRFRYRVLETNGANHHQINEIELFGTPLATYDASLGAPTCSDGSYTCSSGDLLERSGSMSAPESNQPNTIGGCADGTYNTNYGSDESIEKIVVTGDLYEGSTVRVEVSFHAWQNGAGVSSNLLELHYTGSGADPDPTWEGILVNHPTQGGMQTVSAQYTLPAGSLQRLRARIHHYEPTLCTGQGFYDVDDLVFAVREHPDADGDGIDNVDEHPLCAYDPSPTCADPFPCNP